MPDQVCTVALHSVQSNRPDLVTGHRICEVSYSAPHFGQQNMTVSPTFLSVRPCSTISAAHFLTKVSLGTPEAGGRSATTETRRRVNFRKRPDARRFPDDTRRFPNQNLELQDFGTAESKLCELRGGKRALGGLLHRRAGWRVGLKKRPQCRVAPALSV
jgi:hypothetical protein